MPWIYRTRTTRTKKNNRQMNRNRYECFHCYTSRLLAGQIEKKKGKWKSIANNTKLAPITQLDWMSLAASSVMAQWHNKPIPCDSPHPQHNRWNIETFCRPLVGIRPNALAIVRIGYRTKAIYMLNTCKNCVPFWLLLALISISISICVWYRDRWLPPGYRSVEDIYCSPGKSVR